MCSGEEAGVVQSIKIYGNVWGYVCCQWTMKDTKLIVSYVIKPTCFPNGYELLSVCMSGLGNKWETADVFKRLK